MEIGQCADGGTNIIRHDVDDSLLLVCLVKAAFGILQHDYLVRFEMGLQSCLVHSPLTLASLLMVVDVFAMLSTFM